MVHRTLSQGIRGTIRLMLIYGNTPRDIMKMMWRRKFKLLTIAVLILVAVTLISPPLQALDKFWDTLGSGKDKTKKDSAEVE